MDKLALLVLSVSLLIFISCSMSLAEYTYVGPYNVIFNDSEHPVFGLGFDPVYEYISGEELASSYESTFIGNNTTAGIIILESKSSDFWNFYKVMNYTTLKVPKGFTQIRVEDRIIDGLEGIVGIYKNNSNGQLFQKSVIFCSVISSGYSRDTNAAIIIQTLNYTESQFDRLLDTFEFSRLKED